MIILSHDFVESYSLNFIFVVVYIIIITIIISLHKIGLSSHFKLALSSQNWLLSIVQIEFIVIHNTARIVSSNQRSWVLEQSLLLSGLTFFEFHDLGRCIHSNIIPSWLMSLIVNSLLAVLYFLLHFRLNFLFKLIFLHP